MADDINRTREKIGIDKLDPEQRKKLFQEFVRHGGHVIDESKRKRGVIIRKKPYSGPREVEYQVRHGESYKNKVQLEKHPVTSKKKPLPSKKKKYRIIDRTVLLFLGIKNRVISFPGKKLSKNLLKFIEKDLYNSINDIHVALSPIVGDNSAIKKIILLKSRGSNNLFYEMIYRLYDLFNEDELKAIIKVLTDKKTVPETKYIYIFKPFFKKLYILSQYVNEAKLYVEKAIYIYQKKRNIDTTITDQMIAHLKFCVDRILKDFFYQLHILLCLIARRFMPLYSQKLDDFLEIIEKDRIGYIVKTERKKYLEILKRRKELLEKSKKEPAKVDEKEKVEIPKHIKRGIPLVNNLFGKYIEIINFDSENKLRILEENDKLFKTAVLVEIFEKEYSFILTAGKIKFNIDYREGKKIDIKEDLGNAYIKFNKAREEMDEYIEIIKEMNKTEDNPKLTLHQKDVLIDSLKKKRAILNRSLRSKLSEIMKEIEDILSTVILDYNEERHLVQNPDERLYFDPKIDGQKHLNSKKVIEAIIEAFLFVSTFSFMLRFGELSGSGIYISEEDK